MFNNDDIINTTQWYLKVVDSETINNLVIKKILTEIEIRDMIEKNILTFDI